MRKVMQSRTGEHGTCFRASLASILDLKEKQVPDFGEANEDPGIDTFLAKYGLRYQEVPIGNTAPVGYHIITGISPRGGMHAVVGRDGQIVWDPHPLDGTAHGLSTQEKYGLLLPAGAKDTMRTETGKACTNYHLGKTCKGCGVPIDNASKTRECQACMLEQMYKEKGWPMSAATKADVERTRAALRRHAVAVKAKDTQPYVVNQVDGGMCSDLYAKIVNGEFKGWQRAGTQVDRDVAERVAGKCGGVAIPSLRGQNTVSRVTKYSKRTRDSFFTNRLDRYHMEQLLDALGIDIKEYMSRTEAQKNALLETAMKELDRKTGRTKDMKVKDDDPNTGRTKDMKVKDDDPNTWPPAKLDAENRRTAAELCRRYNDFDDIYDEAESDIRPYLSERNWDRFLAVLQAEWNKKPRKAKDSSDPRDGVTKCQACGVGLMGDDVLERGGKVICPECADAAVRKKAKDKTGDVHFSVEDLKFSRRVGGSYATQAEAERAAEDLEYEKGDPGKTRFAVIRVIQSPSRPIFKRVKDTTYPKTDRQYPTVCKLCGQRTRVFTGLSGPDVYDWHNTPAGKNCKAGGKQPDKVGAKDVDPTYGCTVKPKDGKFAIYKPDGRQIGAERNKLWATKAEAEEYLRSSSAAFGGVFRALKPTGGESVRRATDSAKCQRLHRALDAVLDSEKCGGEGRR